MGRNPSIQVEEALRIPRGVQTLAGFRRWSSSDAFPERGRIDFLDGELVIDLYPEEMLHIPPGVDTLEGFRLWTWSDDFPERGRIDFLDGELEIDMTPENLFLHGTVKTEIAAALQEQVTRTGKGAVFVDCTRIVSLEGRLSVEPDVVAVLWDSLEAGRVREVPAASGEAGGFVELEGAPDLVVEVISDSSVQKDRRRLPPLYAKAGVPELWLADARGKIVKMEIHLLGPTGYAAAPSDAQGWSASPFLGRRCRLRRRSAGGSRFVYELELE